jgi:arabinose-5-phosphate isomerase
MADPAGTTAVGARVVQAIDHGLRTIEVEAAALTALHRSLGEAEQRSAFNAAVDLVLRCTGRVVVTGMGKSGLIARKIAATLSSTGTPAFFIHPAEAGHGDLGMIAHDDVVLALSWSGETNELSDIVNYCRRFGVPLVAMTAAPRSTLAAQSRLLLLLPEVEEACPNQLAPTSSTTMQVVLGDALAVALVERRGFSISDFHRFHPKGQLGARLLTVADLMSQGEAVPQVGEAAAILDAAVEMTKKRFGATAVVDADGHLIGAFTDGDLRRSLMVTGPTGGVAEHMSRTPHRVAPTLLASDALAFMNDRQILQLFVCRGDTLIGIIHLHDVLAAGVV